MLAMLATAVACCVPFYAHAADPIATRQNVFGIPFQVSPARTPAEAPRSVQLHVSEDKGANWRMEKQVEPSAGRFPFRAAHDGEYWFLIRTVDASGRTLPDGPQQPGLKVIVDTVSPGVELSATEQSGEVSLQWRATDQAIDPATLKIESRQAATGPWNPVPIQEADVQRTPQANSGKARFRVPAGAGEVVVRMEISDRAGNRATSQSTVRVATAGAVPLAGVNNANPPAVPPNPGLTSNGAQNWPVDQVVQNRTGASPPTNPPASLEPPPLPLTQPVGMSRNAQLVPVAPVKELPNTTLSPPPLMPRAEAAIPNSTTRGNEATNPPLLPSPADTVPRSLFDPGLLPSGVTPQQVNVLKFQVDYSVEAVGPSGVGRVELWGTRDGGRTWQSYGLDNDNQSPLTAIVPGNGLYGFRIVVTDANGRGEPAPRNGDAPQVWIAVDASPPDVRINPPTPQGDRVAIGFSVADEQLDPQSIALFYSHRADGAWIPVARGLANQGRYDWTPEVGVSGPVFLKLEARDRAGNVGTAVTREPLLLDRPVPKSTINGVRAQ